MFRILDGRDAFYQWDLNRQVIVEDNTVNTVHFCNCLQEETLVTEVYEIDGVRVADVPNILLQEAWDLKVYGFCGGKYTKVCNTFAVLPKNKPASYIYEETDVLNWDNLKQEFEELDANTAASLDALAKEIEDNLIDVNNRITNLGGITSANLAKAKAELDNKFMSLHVSTSNSIVSLEDKVDTLEINTTKNIKELSDKYEELKEEVDNLPTGGGSGSSGVKSWNDLEDKPFYEDGETTVILPETTLAMQITEEGTSAGGIEEKLELEAGAEYIITWNDVDYTCKAVEITDGGITATVIGAVGLFTGSDCTECPFIIMPLMVDEGNWFTQVLGIGEYTEVTLSIQKGGFIKKLDNKFLDLEWIPTTLEKELLPPTECSGDFNDRLPVYFEDLIKYQTAVIYIDGKRKVCPITHTHFDNDSDCGVYLFDGTSFDNSSYVFRAWCSNSGANIIFADGQSHTVSICVIEDNKLPSKFLDFEAILSYVNDNLPVAEGVEF